MLIRHYLAWACVVGCGALGARALIDRPEPPRIVTVTAPPTVIAVAVPPAVQPPPTVVVVSAPPPEAAPPAAAVHVGCGDVVTIGVPRASDPEQPGTQLVEVSVSHEGCAIAARTKETLFVSWDAGQTFTRSDAAGIEQMVAVSDRIELRMQDGSLATIRPGAPRERHAPKSLAYAKLFASGKWTALVAEGLVAVTDDSGATWRYLEPRKDMTITGIAGDRLVGITSRPDSEPDGEHLVEYDTTTYVSDLRHAGWREVGTHAGTPFDDAPRYAVEGDEFWGCGSSEKIVDVASGTMVLGGLRADVWPYEVHTTHGVTFANASNELYRLDGADRTSITGDQGIPGSLAGVDAAGTPILFSEYQLLRWSKTGGWRVLLDATP